jgi:hypothetical protein
MKGLWALAVVSLVAAAPAEAQFFTDNFDTYATGSTIMGQGGWETWDTNPGANTTLSAIQSFTAPNALLVAGPADIVHRFTGVNSGTWHARAQVFIPSTSTGEAWFILLNQYAPAATDDNWSVQVVFCVTGCTTAGALPGMVVNLGGSDVAGTGVAPLITNQWVEVRASVNFATNSYSVFYNGVLLDTKQWQLTGTAQLQAMDLFSNGSTQAFMDNIWVDTTVPVELTTFTVQ